MLFTRPYPVPANETERLSELYRYHVLDTEREPVFDDAVRLASNFFGTRTSVIALVDDKRQWFKARNGIEASETGRAEAFCSYTILSNEIMVVPDASADPRFSANPLVVGRPFIRFYAGAPLQTPRGYNIGTLCVIDPEPRAKFGQREKRHLSDLALLVMDQLNRRVEDVERRSQERHATRLKGTISGYHIPPTVVDIENVSGRGALIRIGGSQLAKGDEIILKIDQMQVVATIAWEREEMVGIAFHRELSFVELTKARGRGPKAAAR